MLTFPRPVRDHDHHMTTELRVSWGQQPRPPAHQLTTRLWAHREVPRSHRLCRVAGHHAWPPLTLHTPTGMLDPYTQQGPPKVRGLVERGRWETRQKLPGINQEQSECPPVRQTLQCAF